MEIIKSKIEKKQDIDLNKKITIAEQSVPEEYVKDRMNRLMAVLPDTVTKKEIKEKAIAMVNREIAFNAIMDYLSKQFTYKISESELEEITKNIKEHFLAQRKESDLSKEESESLKKYSSEVAKKMIIKTLIFRYIQKEHNITITEQEIETALKDFSERTNRDISKSYETNKNDFKEIILEEKTTVFLLNKFKIVVDDTKKDDK